MSAPSRPRAYSYIRMSTDMQLKGDSLRRQLEASTKYAATNGLDLIADDRLHDIGVSAFKGDNEQAARWDGFSKQPIREKCHAALTCW